MSQPPIDPSLAYQQYLARQPQVLPPSPPLEFEPLPLLRRSSRQIAPRQPRFEDRFDEIYGAGHRMQDDSSGEECDSVGSITTDDSLSGESSDESWSGKRATDESSDESSDESTDGSSTLAWTDASSVESE